MASAKAQPGAGRGHLLDAITSPIGFFVLALLIVEAFLGTVLLGASLDAKDKLTGVWLGVAMFLLVVIIVSLLVWFKSKAFVFDRQAHLDEQRIETERVRRARGGASLEDFAPVLERTLRGVLGSEQVAARISQASQADVMAVLKQQAEKISNDLKHSAFISVDLTAFDAKLGLKSYPVAAIKSMNDLSDEIYFALEDHVRPYAYGTDWVLRDKATKYVFRTLRMQMGVPVGQPVPDTRTLQEVGINVGMELEALRPDSEKAIAYG